MQNRILDHYLDDLKVQLRHLSLADQRQVLSEVRAHLEEDIAGRRAEDKTLSADEAALQATHGFGDPHDIGVAYGARGGVVRKSTGELLLHVAVLTGRGVARTVGKTVKWTAITVGTLLVLSLLVAVILLVAYQPTIQRGLEESTRYQSRYLFERDETYDMRTSTFQDTFVISEHALSTSFRAQFTADAGCLTVKMTGPDAEVLADTTGDCSPANLDLKLTKPGNYRIEYQIVVFSGSIHSLAYTEERVPAS